MLYFLLLLISVKPFSSSHRSTFSLIWTAWLGVLILEFKLLSKLLQAYSNSGVPQRLRNADGSRHTQEHTTFQSLLLSRVSYPDYAGPWVYVYFTCAKLENLLEQTTFSTRPLAVLPPK